MQSETLQLSDALRNSYTSVILVTDMTEMETFLRLRSFDFLTKYK